MVYIESFDEKLHLFMPQFFLFDETLSPIWCFFQFSIIWWRKSYAC